MTEHSVQTPEEVQKLETSADVVVVRFTASWCGNCDIMKTEVESLMNKYKGDTTVAFCVADCAESADLVEAYKVSKLPHVSVRKKGEEMAKIVGVQDVASLCGVVASARSGPLPTVTDF